MNKILIFNILLFLAFSLLAQDSPMVEMTRAEYKNSLWTGKGGKPTDEKGEDIYLITFTLKQAAVINPTKIWIKGKYMIPFKLQRKDTRDGDILYEGDEIQVVAKATKGIYYTKPPRNFEGEALVEALVNSKKAYFVVKKFEHKIPQ